MKPNLLIIKQVQILALNPEQSMTTIAATYSFFIYTKITSEISIYTWIPGYRNFKLSGENEGGLIKKKKKDEHSC